MAERWKCPECSGYVVDTVEVHHCVPSVTIVPFPGYLGSFTPVVPYVPYVQAGVRCSSCGITFHGTHWCTSTSPYPTTIGDSSVSAGIIS